MGASLTWIIKFLIILVYIKYSDAHGRLLDPVARSSAWRNDSRFPAYYEDNQMFCGGRSVQWDKNGGNCSICGEDYALANKLFDRGGSMYTGIIVKNYAQGQTININVQITANHLGWFEFRICNVDGWSTEATQDCLDQTVLKDLSGNSRFNISSTVMEFQVQLVLPSSLTCDHCVFQWKYNTGNSWGTDPTANQGCLGCGPGQEQFYGCSDISISGSTQSTILSKITTSTTTVTVPSTTISTTTTTATITTFSSSNPTTNSTTTVTSASPLPTTTNASSRKCTNGDGYYADIENDCKIFYICSYTGTQFAQINYYDCPLGTLFDNTFKVCNYADQVKCR